MGVYFTGSPNQWVDWSIFRTLQRVQLGGLTGLLHTHMGFQMFLVWCSQAPYTYDDQDPSKTGNH